MFHLLHRIIPGPFLVYGLDLTVVLGVDVCRQSRNCLDRDLGVEVTIDLGPHFPVVLSSIVGNIKLVCLLGVGYRLRWNKTFVLDVLFPGSFRELLLIPS